MLKKVLAGLLFVGLAIQFIRPEKNIGTAPFSYSIDTVYSVPKEVRLLLNTACADCHSNNTVYPWYAKVQPLAWWLQHHVDEGKAKLNFDEFAKYPPKRQYHTLKEIIDEVEQNEMPLPSYTLIHRRAVLNANQKATLTTWAQGVMKAVRQKIYGKKISSTE
jgi:hypothetical protein